MPEIWCGILDFQTLPGSLTTDSTNFHVIGRSQSNAELNFG